MMLDVGYRYMPGVWVPDLLYDVMECLDVLANVSSCGMFIELWDHFSFNQVHPCHCITWQYMGQL